MYPCNQIVFRVYVCRRKEHAKDFDSGVRGAWKIVSLSKSIGLAALYETKAQNGKSAIHMGA